MSEPFVSVIVAVRDEEETIRKCIDSLLRLDYPSFEVIVVDDGSRDATPSFVRSYADRVTVMTNVSAIGPSRSRNRAATRAEGELVAFTDGDCIVGREWLAELVRCFTTCPDAVSGGGAQAIPDDATPLERDIFALFKKVGIVTDYARRIVSSAVIDVDHNPSCNVIYRKDLFLREGGFPEDLWPGEDVELDYRFKKAGRRIVFNPRALVYHYRPKTIRSFMRMLYRYGQAQGALVRKYGFFRRIQWVPIAALGGLAVLAAASALYGVLVVSLVAALGAILLFAYCGGHGAQFGLLLLGGISWHIGFFGSFVKRGGPSCS